MSYQMIYQKSIKEFPKGTVIVGSWVFCRQHHVSCKNDCCMSSHCIIGKGVTLFAQVKVIFADFEENLYIPVFS